MNVFINRVLQLFEKERNRHDVDLLLIKLERVDNDFYESLIKFIADHGYKPKVIVHNTDSLSINGLEIVSSKRQLFRHKEEISMTSQIPCSRLTGYLTLAAAAKCPIQPLVGFKHATWLVARGNKSSSTAI